MVMSFTMENENPFNKKDKVVKKIIQDKIAPYFSLKINNMNTINSK